MNLFRKPKHFLEFHPLGKFVNKGQENQPGFVDWENPARRWTTTSQPGIIDDVGKGSWKMCDNPYGHQLYVPPKVFLSTNDVSNFGEQSQLRLVTRPVCTNVGIDANIEVVPPATGEGLPSIDGKFAANLHQAVANGKGHAEFCIEVPILSLYTSLSEEAKAPVVVAILLGAKVNGVLRQSGSLTSDLGGHVEESVKLTKVSVGLGGHLKSEHSQQTLDMTISQHGGPDIAMPKLTSNSLHEVLSHLQETWRDRVKRHPESWTCLRINVEHFASASVSLPSPIAFGGPSQQPQATLGTKPTGAEPASKSERTIRFCLRCRSRVRNTAELNGEAVATLKKGAIVTVVEKKRIGTKVRARISKPSGWITLFDEGRCRGQRLGGHVKTIKEVSMMATSTLSTIQKHLEQSSFTVDEVFDRHGTDVLRLTEFKKEMDSRGLILTDDMIDAISIVVDPEGNDSLERDALKRVVSEVTGLESCTSAHTDDSVIPETAVGALDLFQNVAPEVVVAKVFSLSYTDGLNPSDDMSNDLKLEPVRLKAASDMVETLSRKLRSASECTESEIPSRDHTERTLLRQLSSTDAARVVKAGQQLGRLASLSQPIISRIVGEFIAADDPEVRDAMKQVLLRHGQILDDVEKSLEFTSESRDCVLNFVTSIEGATAKLTSAGLVGTAHVVEGLAAALKQGSSTFPSNAVLMLTGPFVKGRYAMINALSGKVLVPESQQAPTVLPVVYASGDAYSVSTEICRSGSEEFVRNLQLEAALLFKATGADHAGDMSLRLLKCLGGAQLWTKGLVCIWVAALQTAAAEFLKMGDGALGSQPELLIKVTIPAGRLPCAIFDVPCSADILHKAEICKQMLHKALPGCHPRVCLVMHFLEHRQLTQKLLTVDVSDAFGFHEGQRVKLPAIAVVHATSSIPAHRMAEMLQGAPRLKSLLESGDVFDIDMSSFLAWRLLQRMPGATLPEPSDAEEYTDEISEIFEQVHLKSSGVKGARQFFAQQYEKMSSPERQHIEDICLHALNLAPFSNYKLFERVADALSKLPKLLAQDASALLKKITKSEIAQLDEIVANANANAGTDGFFQRQAKICEALAADEMLSKYFLGVYSVAFSRVMEVARRANHTLTVKIQQGGFAEAVNLLKQDLNDEVAQAFITHLPRTCRIGWLSESVFYFGEAGTRALVDAYADWCGRLALETFRARIEVQGGKANYNGLDIVSSVVLEDVATVFVDMLNVVNDQNTVQLPMLRGCFSLPPGGPQKVEFSRFKRFESMLVASPEHTGQTVSDVGYAIGKELSYSYFTKVAEIVLDNVFEHHQKDTFAKMQTALLRRARSFGDAESGPKLTLDMLELACDASNRVGHSFMDALDALGA